MTTKKKTKKVLDAMQKDMTKRNVNLYELSELLGLRKDVLYFYNAGTTVSIPDLIRISVEYKIDYEDVVWEYRENVNHRLSDPIKRKIGENRYKEKFGLQRK